MIQNHSNQTSSALNLQSWKSTEMTDVHANVADLRVYKTWHSRGLINDLPMLSTQYILLQSAELIADNQLLEYRLDIQRFQT